MLKGVTHVHSTFSFDGTLSISELRELFAGKGLDFVLMSEHIEGLSTDSIQTFIKECRKQSSDSLLIVPGIEIDELNLLIFGIRTVRDFTDSRDLVEQFNSQDALFVLAHPFKLHNDALAFASKFIDGVEIWNGKYDGKVSPRMSNIKLFEELCKANRKLTATCGLDFHRTSDYADLWMEVQTNDRSEQGVLSAMRLGNAAIHANGSSPPIVGRTSRYENGWFRLKSTAYTSVYDALYRLNAELDRHGIRVPRPLKVWAKKYF